jgi:hypothetical protein
LRVNIAYFVHDLCDAAVLRRIRMLRRAGAEITVLGFRRAGAAPGLLDNVPAIDLGRTYDGRLLHRAMSVVRRTLGVTSVGAAVRKADVVLARNLEMLVLAAAARACHAPHARLAYECIDVHRLMVQPGLAGDALRRLEHALLGRCDLLILSSPAYARDYFEPRQGLGAAQGPKILLLENKVFAPDGGSSAPERASGPPWRIGWFGMLRCRRSFDLLLRLARQSAGRVEVVMSGKPSERELIGFAREVAGAAGVTFTGAYTPEDVGRMYGEVHFSWAIDFFESGANSDWLLPNRIYEGGLYGAAPLALRRTETGVWLAKRGLGVLFNDASRELEPFFRRFDAAGYRALLDRSLNAPRSWFAADERDGLAFVEALAGAV